MVYYNHKEGETPNKEKEIKKMTIKMYNKCGNYELTAETAETAIETAKREIREGRANRADVRNESKVLAILTRKAFGRVEVAFAK